MPHCYKDACVFTDRIKTIMVFDGNEGGCHGNNVDGSVYNGYLAAEKGIYTIDPEKSLGNQNGETGKERKAPAHYSLRSTLLGCFVTLLAAFFVAVGQSCIQVRTKI